MTFLGFQTKSTWKDRPPESPLDLDLHGVIQEGLSSWEEEEALDDQKEHPTGLVHDLCVVLLGTLPNAQTLSVALHHPWLREKTLG